MRSPAIRISSALLSAGLFGLLALPGIGQELSVKGLPGNLTPLPAGRVNVGLDARTLFEVAEQVQPRNMNARVIDLKNTVSELGVRRADIEPFLLGRYQVTNEEYLVFVKATGHRFPYHWWRYGRKDDYDEHLARINEQFPRDPSGPILYWERHYRELPYELKDDRGNDISKQPVTFVSWRDATAYAAWAGMRLPTEEEWTYAARGDGKNLWVWGVDRKAAIGDKYESGILEELGLKDFRDQVLKNIGVTGAVTEGPFGHGDMVGQVWEWTATRHGPLGGADAFDAEFKKFQNDRRYRQLPADRAAEHLQYAPTWEEDKFVIKGGAYAYGQSTVQFHIDARHRLPSTETTSLIGFRVAKSPQPGRDAALSIIQSEYDMSVFGGKRTPNLEDQIGVERYDLDDHEMITGYHTVSLVPVSHIFEGRAPNMRKAIEDLQIEPKLVGTLLTTEALRAPELDPGLYSVYYRPAGIPAELEDAMKEGNREKLQEAAQRAAAERRGQQYTPPPPAEGAGAWRDVIKKYGIEESELEGEDAVEKIKHIRMNPGNVIVPTDSPQLILRDNGLQYRMALPATKPAAEAKSYKGARMAQDQVEGRERFTFTFAPPLSNDRGGTPLEIQMKLVLTTTRGSSNWRTPENLEGAAQKPGSGSSRSGR